jgi:hypothetical protein
MTKAPDPEATAAVAEAQRFLHAVRRPRCWR